MKQVAKPAKHYKNISSKIKQEIESYALIHGTKAAIDCFSKVYTKDSLKVACVVKIKLFFMDWFYYNLVILIK